MCAERWKKPRKIADDGCILYTIGVQPLKRWDLPDAKGKRSPDMASVYNLLREACGLSQSEAADFHETRLDSIKSWCSDRRSAPIGVINELQELMRDVDHAGEEFAALLKRISRGNVFIVGLPIDDKDSTACGFPSPAAHLRAIAIAISRLPDDAEIRMVERVRGAIPSATMQRGKTKMRNNPHPLHHDTPDPAPRGFQTVVTSQPRTRAEIDRAAFRAENGARFSATLQATPEGPQVRYTVEADTGNSTNVLSDIRLFKTEAEALAWLDQAAAFRGFAKYPLERRK
jgi:hypothetical protein